MGYNEWIRPLKTIKGSDLPDGIIGGKSDDRLLGLDGEDALRGRAGDDILDGGSEADLLVGGSGADLFVIGEGNDLILDFNPKEGDRLVLRNDPGISINADGRNTIISSLDGSIQTTLLDTAAPEVNLAIQQRLHPSKTITFNNGETFELEVAETVLQQRLGLMQRGCLRSLRGMLFPKEDRSYSYVWMYNCIEPLDIIYLDDNEIVGAHSNVPIYEGLDPKFAPIYGSEHPCTSFVELRAGTINELGIEIGSLVDIQSI